MLSRFTYIILLVLGFAGCSAKPPTASYNPNTPAGYPAAGDSLTEIWHRVKSEYIPTDVQCTPYSLGDRIIIVYDSIIDCLDKATGKVYWSTNCLVQYPTGTNSDCMVVENGRIYTQVARWSFRCLDVNTGAIIWSFDLPTEVLGDGWGRYSHSPDAIYITAKENHQLYALSKVDGHVIWVINGVGIDDSSIRDPISCWAASPAYSNGRIYVGARYAPGVPPLDHDGGVECYDAQSGKRLWAKTFPKADSSVDFPLYNQFTDNEGANLVVPYENNMIASVGFTIACIDTQGNILWRKSPYVNMAMSLYDWQPYLVNGTLYDYNNGSSASFAWGLDPNTGTSKWAARTALNGELHTLLEWGVCLDSANIYKVTDDNWLIGQSLATGAVTMGVHISPYCFAPFGGAMLVEGERIYFVDDSAVHCYQRIKR